MSIRRFSSRTHRLDQSVLLQHLQGARSYKRIAGYFTSSLFEVAHEQLESIPDIKIVCNVDIDPNDLKVAQLREAKMIGRWNDTAIEAEALWNRARYQRLDQFLAKRGQVIRVAPDSVCGFVHGKAGIVELADGRKLGFIGSMNETRNGWQRHYEILWEDDSPEGVAWLEAEFDFLWNAASPLPNAVIREVKRRGQRHEIEIEGVSDDSDVAPAALIESPMYRQGLTLQPWQQEFITECIRHYHNHGIVRLLLADEVGLGKTLSLATAALALCLLLEKEQKRRKPVIIFAPATLCEQWQTELIDKLGIPCARWHTQKKEWWDTQNRAISPAGREQIARCPLRIGIVSTGLMLRDSTEKQHLLDLRYALIILDEAHKARSRQGFGKDAGSPNELLAFMRQIAACADHVLLGTATPIQTRQEDLWDLVGILHQGSGNFVLGHDLAQWHKPAEILPILAGEQRVTSPEHAWALLRSPLPLVESTQEPRARKLYSTLRSDLGLSNPQWQAGSFDKLSRDSRDDLEDELTRDIAGASFFQRENPLVRHVVLRKRTTLEDQGLLKKIGVDIHPDSQLSREPQAFHVLFEQLALRTSEDFRAAYAAARQFGKALGKRGKGGGFMKNLLEQRICSSIVAGLNTAKALLEGRTVSEEDDDELIELAVEADNSEEIAALQRLIARLQQVDGDPKLRAIIHYLEQEKWLDHGIIIFSQYYDTARWVADSLAARYREAAIGLYAGAGRSRLYQLGESVAIERETLKKMVAEHQIKIMVATDAACEGLNLQTLGTLINVDLPWNPTKLEQRIGRIKRFGQVRDKVDMLNLVNEQTVDEKVYERLSERMRDRYNLFGALPDTIKDEWIEDIETLGEKLDEFINAQKQANGFDLRYNTRAAPTGKDWRDCASVLSRTDFVKLMSAGWV
jgi:SNF2 family DNA or RNA helicase